ncbi:MAG: Hemolysin-type calcium-binding region, partial [Frankiales bacterium]|nr:Hemolysin-type calcium-binding region [Frankiales bacterium]
MTAANRLLGAGALVCTLGLVGPAVAAAVPWEASPSGGSLSITGGDTMANKDFRVSVFGTGLRVTEYNGTAGSTSSGSCTYTDAVDDTVDCPAPGTSTIFAGLGPGNDQFDIVNTALPVLVFGNAGSDTIIGGLGADLLVGATGSDTLKGGAGDDLLTDGATFLFGDSGSGGNDVMQGQGDDDTLDAGFGSSALAAQTRAGGRDTLDGGNGLDVIDYSLRDAPLTITEADGVANDGESGEQDQVLSGERILGGSAADHIAGAAGGNV